MTRDKHVLHSMMIVKGLIRNKGSVLLNNRGGISYASTLLIGKINKRPSKRKARNTDITLHTTTKHYHVDVSDIGGYRSFHLKVLLQRTGTTKPFVKRESISKNSIHFNLAKTSLHLA